MKNKFMTKALAVVLSASMALSLSSATALTANGAAAPKLTKKAVTVKVGKKAKNKLAKASFKAGWRITKATVKKTKVAKATFKKNKKVVVVTGVQKGKSKVVVALKNVKTGAAKKVKFTVKVKVDEVKPEPEPVADVASMIEAKQTKNNEAVITLDKEIEAAPTADVLKIYLNDDAAGVAPTQINLGTDKKTLIVNYDYSAAAEGKTFKYTFKTVDGSIKGEPSFETSDYKVAKIVADAEQTVEAGKLSPVKFTLQDANGIDVTGFGTNLSYTTVSFEGDDARNIPNAANPQVLINEVGKSTKMTITYSQDTTVEPVVVTVTAVDPQPTAAKAMKYTKGARNAWLFSSEISTEEIYVDNGASTINFWAKKDDATSALGYSAVKYDAIEITVTPEDVLSVSDEKLGKYDSIKVEGLKTGTATITLKCTEYVGDKELTTPYTIPVTVKPKDDDLATFTTDKASVTLTNALDSDYHESVKLFALNTKDQAVDATFSYEILDSKGNPSNEIRLSNPAASTWKSYKDGVSVTIDAQGAKKGTYSVKFTCEGQKAGGQDSETKTRTISVRVDDVLETVSADTASYSMEITTSQSEIYIKDTGDNHVESTIGMTVKVGGKFAGYVRNTSGVYTVGEYPAAVAGFTTGGAAEYIASKAGLTDLTFYVQDKAQQFAHESNNSIIYLAGDKVKAADFTQAAKLEVPVAADTKDLFTLSLYDEGVDADDVYFFGNNSSKNVGIAEAGTYSIVAYNDRLDEKAKVPTGVKQIGNKKSVAVKYDISAPVVTYSNSESADMYANPSTWLVLEDGIDTLSFAYRANGEDGNATGHEYANKYATAKTKIESAKPAGVFAVPGGWLRSTNNQPSAGSRVFATAIPVITTAAGERTTDCATVMVKYVLENEKTIGA